jgi:hypothetical protein
VRNTAFLALGVALLIVQSSLFRLVDSGCHVAGSRRACCCRSSCSWACTSTRSRGARRSRSSGLPARRLRRGARRALHVHHRRDVRHRRAAPACASRRRPSHQDRAGARVRARRGRADRGAHGDLRRTTPPGRARSRCSCCRPRAHDGALAPFVFRVAERVHQATVRAPPGEGAARVSLSYQRSDVSEFRKRFRLDRLGHDVVGSSILLGGCSSSRSSTVEENQRSPRRTSSSASRSRRPAADHPRSRRGKCSPRAALRTTSTSSRAASTWQPRGPRSPSTSGSAGRARPPRGQDLGLRASDSVRKTSRSC